MADPGFSPGGGAPTPKVGARTYFFCRKLHENERILTPGGARIPGAPLRSATAKGERSAKGDRASAAAANVSQW